MMNKHVMVFFAVCFVPLCLQAQSASKAPELYKQGVEQLDAENTYRAIEEFKAALSLNPQYLDPVIKLAEAYYALDEYDEALRWVKSGIALAKDSPKLLNIHGRILLALGKTDEAAAIFRSILKREPYNIDAMLGLAEFSLAKGDELGARSQYLNSLRYNDHDRRILLSLTLMYENIGDRNKSESFLLKALQYNPESPLVQTLAAEYYLRMNQPKDAEFHAKTALALHPGYVRALVVLGDTYIRTGKYSECISVMDELLKILPTHARAFYLRGLSLFRLKKPDQAIQSLDAALRADSSDEISRTVLENILMHTGAKIDDPLRARYAAYHLDQAASFRKKNLYARALFHFTRGIQVAPAWADGRVQYAQYLKDMNRGARLVQELHVLKDTLGVNTAFVKDNLEIYESLLSRSVSHNWGIKDQFNDVARDPLLFRIYWKPLKQSVEHADGEEFLAQYFQDLLGTSDKISFAVSSDSSTDENPRSVDSDATAFKSARDDRADYYVTLEFMESGDDFKCVARLYLARTGTLIRTYDAYRTGNFRVQNAVWQNVERLQAEIPVRGKLIRREVNDGLISLGAADGIKTGDVLHIVARDAYVLQGQAPGFVFSQDKKTGSITIGKVDEKVAEGTLKREGFYDRINLGDVVLRDSESMSKPQDATANFPFLYNRIRGIR